MTKNELYEAAKAAEKIEIAARLKYNALEETIPVDRAAYKQATTELEEACAAEQAAWDAYNAVPDEE